jgi:hypothetical protein
MADHFLDLCFGEVEYETDWRVIAFRLGSDIAPSLGQRGSCSNAVFTAKYTLISFIPKALFEQFRRVANIYFLFIAILMVSANSPTKEKGRMLFQHETPTPIPRYP